MRLSRVLEFLCLLLHLKASYTSSLRPQASNTNMRISTVLAMLCLLRLLRLLWWADSRRRLFEVNSKLFDARCVFTTPFLLGLGLRDCDDKLFAISGVV